MNPQEPVSGVNRRRFLKGAVAAGSLALSASDGEGAERPRGEALFLNERGRVLLFNNEEISRWRWAKKQFELPPAVTGAKADVWALLQMYESNCEPLEVFVNGKPLGRIEPNSTLTPSLIWSKIEIPAGRLVAGVNAIEFRCQSPAMDAWMLGIEPGHRDPRSFLSTDRGGNWRNHDMGVHNVLRGEYVVRLRSHAGGLRDPAPPNIAYEDPSHARVRESLELIPPDIRKMRDAWEQLLALRTWVAKSWGHKASGPIYTPWDPWTILNWAKADRGQGREGTICMCMHFATLFAALAAALGHRTRGVVVTDALDKPTGHFMAEVWDKRLGQWVLHDPNFDVHYADGKPLSAIELAVRSHRGRALNDWLVTGKGMPKGPPLLLEIFNEYFVSGKSFRLTGLWSRNDYVSHPDAAPPSHGAVSYCEPEIVWYNPPGIDLAPMFPYRVGDREYFDGEA